MLIVVLYVIYRIGALCFDEEKLKEMVGQVSQNLALYEKLRVVGKGKLSDLVVKCFDCGIWFFRCIWCSSVV